MNMKEMLQNIRIKIYSKIYTHVDSYLTNVKRGSFEITKEDLLTCNIEVEQVSSMEAKEILNNMTEEEFNNMSLENLQCLIDKCNKVNI